MLGPARVVWRALVLAATIVELAIGALLARLPVPVPRWLRTHTNIRHVLGSRGLTYAKAGQFLSTRLDLFRPEVCRDLEKLFEQVTPVPYSRLKPMLEAELGSSVHEAFATFNERPIAAASVAQVHEATLTSGERVAVKIQRPGIARTFNADMMLFRLVAVVADWFQLLGASSAREAVDQFWLFTARELDFIQEGKTADRLRISATAHEVIPTIYWRWTTSRVLTMEFIDGVSLARLYAAKEGSSGESVDDLLPPDVLRQAMRNLAYASLHQIFGTGFFHGDPHLGNLLLLQDGSVAFVDFGIFGELTAHQRTLLRGHLEHLAAGDITQSFRYYAALQMMTADTDAIRFSIETQKMMRRWHMLSIDPATPVHERLAGRLADGMLAALRQNHVKVDMNLILFWRVFLVLDSTALRFTSDIDLIGELRRYFESTSPSMDQRLVEFLANPDRVDDLVRGAHRAPEHAGTALQHGVDRLSRIELDADESSQTENEKNHEAGLLAVTLVLVSSVIALAGATSVPVSVRAALIVVQMALLLLCVAQIPAAALRGRSHRSSDEINGE